MGLAELRAEFEKKLKNGGLKIVKNSPANLNLQPAPRQTALSLAPRPAADAPPDLLALTNAASLWATRSTNQDLERARDIARDKLRAARLFFAWLDKSVLDVTPMDVAEWLEWLARERRLKPRTVYGYCSHLSSFFEWLAGMPELAPFLKFNPVKAAFPRFPEAYQSAGTRSLSDAALRDLWREMERARRSGVVGLRDYAIFRFFAATGDRRREILGLRGSDVELLKKGLIYFSRKKGGNRIGKTINDREVAAALLEYLKASGRKPAATIGRDRPLWLAHDGARSAKNRDPDRMLSSHAFAARMQRYAERAGIHGFHLHQLRHTFARIVSEDTQSLAAAQEALGHKNMKTTRIYVERIEIKSDSHSHRLKDRIRRR